MRACAVSCCARGERARESLWVEAAAAVRADDLVGVWWCGERVPACGAFPPWAVGFGWVDDVECVAHVVV